MQDGLDSTAVAQAYWQLPMALDQSVQLMCFLPLLMAAGWQGTVENMRPEPHGRQTNVEPHHQLVIPEPIRADGERALFA